MLELLRTCTKDRIVIVSNYTQTLDLVSQVGGRRRGVLEAAGTGSSPGMHAAAAAAAVAATGGLALLLLLQSAPPHAAPP